MDGATAAGGRSCCLSSDEISRPAGIDFFIGFGPELDARCADMIPPKPGPDGEQRDALLARDLSTLSGLDRMRVGAYRNPPDLSGQGIINSRGWRAAEVPSTNGHGNARAVARLYAALSGDGKLDGVHILSPATIEMAIAEQVYGEDVVLQRPTRFGLGFQLTMPERRLGPGPPRFRALRRRRLARVRRSRRARRVRLRDEPGPWRLAAQARAPSHRSGLRGAVALEYDR